MASDCIFCRIAAGELPAEVIDRCEDWMIFSDIAPAAPTPVLATPRGQVPGGAAADDNPAQIADLVGALTLHARRAGIEEDGYRLVINEGRDGAQTVPHLHIHLLAGRRMDWPPG
ncbi:MAG: HIT domain-containing protein [Chloroflexota bacterium]|nr:HIT domain-containing protein [Chloroflexota bacterium]